MSVLPPDVAASVSEWIGEGWSVRPLAGDASVRAYFRVTARDGESYILAYYPEEVRAQLRRAVAAYECLAPHVAAPSVLHASDAAVLQADVSDRTIFDVLHEDREEGMRLYGAAVDLLVGFQKAPDPGLNTPFSEEFFRGELAMTGEFFLEKLAGVGRGALEEYATKISMAVARHPYVLCHRDYHGQNIHVLNDTIYLIDYQDLRRGPDTYDLASLLRDRGVASIIGREAELAFLDRYAAACGAEGNVRRRYFETLLQRSLKVLGTFARQPIARGRMHYLEFIPAALESVRRCTDELPEFAPLRDIVPQSIDLADARERARKLYESR